MNLNLANAESPLTTNENDGDRVVNKTFNCFDDSVNPSLNVESLENPLKHDLSKLMGKEDVVNLSTFQLAPCEKSVLSYGYNFCPTPGAPDRGEVWRELNELTKKYL